jgi:phosphate transport system substrate-binding protein
MHIRLKHIQHAAGLGRRASTVRLTRAGSTFDAPFFTKAFAAYQQSRPGVTVSYASVGSSAGITRFTAGTVNFGATDVPASSTDLAAARGGPAVQVPVDLGGISVAYNVMTRQGTPGPHAPRTTVRMSA